MPAHNNIIPVSRFKKDSFKSRVKVTFDVPIKAKARKEARLVKAAKMFPRPLKQLRPVVHCPGRKNNWRVREGRGFTKDELIAVGINNMKYARSIGISIDKRRKNRSEEGKSTNVTRLQDYLKKIVLFPKVAGKPQKGPVADADKATLEKVTAATAAKTVRSILPVAKKEEVEFKPITDSDKKAMKAFDKIRRARQQQQRVGYVHKKKLAAEEAEKAAGTGGKKKE